MGSIFMVALTVAITVGVWVYIGGMTEDKSIPKFPLFDLKDAPEACTANSDDPLFTMKHVGGDVVTWNIYVVHVLDGATDRVDEIDWGGATPGELPDRVAVGESVSAAESVDTCTLGAVEVWTVQILAESFEDSIVYERYVRIS